MILICVCVCVYACAHVHTQPFNALCIHPVHFLESAGEETGVLTTYARLYFNLLAFREKNLGCPMDLCITFILVHISSCSVSFKLVAIETFIIFLAFHAIDVHNVSFYSVTFSGIRW